jgi:hypothetical protein
MSFKYFRVYKSGEKSPTRVFESEKELRELIEYNTVMRFGCAQFLDGKCIYEGYLTPEDIETARLKYCV